MFLENNIQNQKFGWIEVITGSMFSGKTEELIRRLKRAIIANQHVEVFKPKIDDRFAKEKIVSHNENELFTTPVDKIFDILALSEKAEVIGIDEAQFFDNELVKVCSALADTGKRVIVAGLDMDYTGKPFGSIPELMAVADYVSKVHAICVKCGNLANFSHRIIKNDNLVVLGSKSEYEPLCRRCFINAKN